MSALMDNPSLEDCKPRPARAARKPMAHKALILGDNGVISEATVTDLSYDGCGVRCDDVFHVGERVKLSVFGRGAIVAHVCWCNARKAGLRFGVPEEPQKPVSKRTIERVLVEATIHVRRQGSTGYPVRVHDASPEGCKVDDLECYNPDEPIWVRFPGLQPIDARLCWRDASQAGLRFRDPIHPAVFDLLVTRMRYPAG